MRDFISDPDRCAWPDRDSTGRIVMLAVSVGEDGDWWPVVLVGDAPQVTLDDGSAGEAWASCVDCPPAHERTGPLPYRYRLKTAAMMPAVQNNDCPRCGAVAGEPCVSRNNKPYPVDDCHAGRRR